MSTANSNPDQYGVSWTGRNDNFKNSWIRYCINGATTPNWTDPMPAP